MKRHYMLNALLVLMAFSQQSQASQEIEKSLKNDFNKTQQKIGNVFTNAFLGVKVSEVVKSPLGRQNLSNCVDAIASLQPLIAEYSKDYAYRVDSALIDTAKLLEKECYNLFHSTLGLGEDLRNGEFKIAQNDMQKLNELETRLSTLRQTLEAKTGTFFLNAKEECNRMLIYATTLLESATNKAQKDFITSKEWIQLVQQNTAVGTRAQERAGEIIKGIPRK